MKKFYNFITLYVILIMFLSCGKSEEKTVKIEKKNLPEKKIIEKSHKIILKIDNEIFFEKDFKNYLKLHFKTYSNLKNRNMLYSYMFEQFIIQKMILLTAKHENYPFDLQKLKSKIDSMFTNKSEIEKKELLNVELVNEYIDKKLYKKIGIKENEIRKYYNDNKDKYRRNAEVLLYEIKLNDKKRANEIRAILNTKPYRFSEFAKNESISKIAKPDGSLGYIEVDALPESFRKFIKSARLNKVTPVVQLLYGNIKGKKIYTYHIFKIVKRKKKRLLFFSRVKDSIKKELILQKKDEVYRNFIKELNKKLKIKVITDNLFFKYIKNK